MTANPPRLVVGITGASVPRLSVHLLGALRELGGERTRLAISRAALRTIELETGMSPERVAGLADVYHRRGDIAASIAPGPFPTTGIDGLLAHLTGKVLDQFGIEHELYRRWHSAVRPVPPAGGAAR